MDETRWPRQEVTPENSGRLLLERLDRFFQAGMRVGPVLMLEVGCGDGRGSKVLYQHLVQRYGDKGARLYTLDLNMDKILQISLRLRQDGFRGVYPVRGDLYNLPMPAGQFDYFIALNVFFWAKRRELLREAHRVLRREGRMFVYDVIPASAGQPRPLATFSFDRNQIARLLDG